MTALFSSSNLEKYSRILWAAVLLTLPVTSFRYFPLVGDSTQVRPLALYPLIVLLPLLLVRMWRKEIPNPWPGSLVLLGAFLLAALLASALGAWNAPLDLRGSSYFDRVLRAWVTAGIGVAFFLAAIWMNRDENEVRFSVKWLLLGLCLHIVWSLVQAISFYTPLIPRETMRDLQTSFSMRVPMKNRRFSGMAFEASWLAGQITTLYMPWLVAALLTRTRVFQAKWVEPVLFIIALFLLFFSFSRGGVLYFLVAAAVTVWVAGGDFFRRAREWFTSAFRSEVVAPTRVRDIAVRVSLVLVLVAVVAGSGVFMFQKRYFNKLFSGFEKADNIEEYIVYNYAGGRAAYAWAAMGAYSLEPWTGVGLGASGLYIYDYLPDFSKTSLFEIARQLDPSSRAIPNPKSMYVRVLAETGVLGAALFLAFLFSMLGDIRVLLHSGAKRIFGLAGLFTWIAIFLYNSTQDSLAAPNLWINLGILIGLARAYTIAEAAKEIA
jgi:O-antigen ligase